MTGPTIILYDDARASAWEPFTLTRPAGELLFGALTMRERAERVFDARVERHLTTARHLLAYDEPGAPGVSLVGEPHGTSGPTIYLLSRAVPHWPTGGDSPRNRLREGAIAIGESRVGWFSPDGQPPSEDALLGPGDAADATNHLEGRVLENVWELIAGNADQITRDVLALHSDPPPPALPDGVFHQGEHPLVIDASARVEPGCLLDTSQGPIWLDRDTSVHAFTRLSGPAYIGPASRILGGTVEAVSLGPVCRVHGEISSTVCLGYTNKQHDGHLGKAYLGRWVNLGAETSNSDLKNDYGSVRIWTPEGRADTGETKLGCLIGDHVKTGIGVLINTGTVIGAGSNVFGAVLPPAFVPPFSWGSGEELVEYRLEKFLEVTGRAMARRDVELTDRMREQLSSAFELGRGYAGPDEDRSERTGRGTS